MEKTNTLSRRTFVKLAGAASLISPGYAFEAAKKRRFKIGSTFILWGYGANNLEPALADMSTLGFHAFETFGGVIEEYEKNRCGFAQVIEKYKVPIVSAFCATDVLDPSKTKSELEKLVGWTKMLKANGLKKILPANGDSHPRIGRRDKSLPD